MSADLSDCHNLDVKVLQYFVCAYVYVWHVHMCICLVCSCECGCIVHAAGSGTALGIGGCLSSCFRQGLLFAKDYARLAALWASGILLFPPPILPNHREFWDYRCVLLCPV